jgi:hypothetical protein
VRVRGERIAVAGATVLAVPEVPPPGREPAWIRRATTDADGRFVLDDLPRGPRTLIILAPGFHRAEIPVPVSDSGDKPTELYVDRDIEAAHRTVVDADRDVQTPDPPRVVLSREEAATMPGSQGDPLRALTSLPGTARPPMGLGLLVLRGAAPWQSLTMVGEHPVPRAFHAVPFAAIMPNEAIDAVEYTPGNASARYGPLAGGVVGLQPRTPRTDAIHGHATVDLMGAGASLEGPIKKSSFFVAARRGWLDSVFRVAEAVAQSGTWGLPSLWDYQGWIVRRHGRARLEARLLGSGDRVLQRNTMRNPPPGVEKHRILYDFRSQFHRADLVFRYDDRRTSILVSPTLRLQQDSAEQTAFSEFRRREIAPGWRAEVDTRLSSAARLVVGTDGTITPYEGEVRFYGPSFVDGEGAWAVTNREAVAAVEASMGAYAITHFGRDRWRVSPGVRAQAFAFGDTAIGAMDPRANARFGLTDRVSLDLGVGRYSVPRVQSRSGSLGLIDDAASVISTTLILPRALVESFEPRIVTGNAPTALRLLDAKQASASFDVELPYDVDLRVGAFGRRWLDPGASGVEDGTLQVTSPQGDGWDLGGELLLRRRFTRRLYGWVAYTIMRNWETQYDRRNSHGLIVDDAPRRFAGSFDQRHNLVALASYRLPRDWRVGARFRLTSGSPYTPFIGVVDGEGALGPQTPITGETNAARFPVFHQLDIRVDKTWRRDRASIEAYVDVQNVYNRENVEAWVYHSDFRSRQGTFGLPIFPSLGVTVRW